MAGKAAKAKPCRICKGMFTPWNTMQPTCSPECAIEKVRQDKLKAEDKAHREREKEFRANDTALQKRLAQRAFNAYIRARDRHLGCISCDKGPDWPGQWAAGHFKTIGARGDLRFNEDNCHKQCNTDCNKGKSGNIWMYRPSLIIKIGLERVEILERVGPPKRYRAEDLREITKIYRMKLKAIND